MSQLKNCIKVRVPTSDGWKYVRMDRDIDGFYHAIDGYDFKLIEKSNYDEVIPDYFFSDGSEYSSNTVLGYNSGVPFEVSWQGDEWP